MIGFNPVMKGQSDRVLLLMAEDNIHSQKELALRIKRAPSLVSGYLKSESDINESFVLRLQGLLGWSANWIRTGSGPKRLSERPTIHQTRTHDEAVPLRLVDETDVTTTSAGSDFRDLDDGTVLMTILLVDEYAYASYPQGWKDPEYLQELPKHSLVLPKRDRGFYRSFAVRGDSMDDGTVWAILSGDVVTGRRIEPDDWGNKIYIKENKYYVINSRDGLFVKRIVKHRAKEGIIQCASVNEDKEGYPDFEINLSEVNELYLIVKVDRNWQV